MGVRRDFVRIWTWTDKSAIIVLSTILYTISSRKLGTCSRARVRVRYRQPFQVSDLVNVNFSCLRLARCRSPLAKPPANRYFQRNGPLR